MNLSGNRNRHCHTKRILWTDQVLKQPCIGRNYSGWRSHRLRLQGRSNGDHGQYDTKGIQLGKEFTNCANHLPTSSSTKMEGGAKTTTKPERSKRIWIYQQYQHIQGRNHQCQARRTQGSPLLSDGTHPDQRTGK